MAFEAYHGDHQTHSNRLSAAGCATRKPAAGKKKAVR
jgi:hypothetical protein